MKTKPIRIYKAFDRVETDNGFIEQYWYTFMFEGEVTKEGFYSCPYFECLEDGYCGRFDVMEVYPPSLKPEVGDLVWKDLSKEVKKTINHAIKQLTPDILKELIRSHEFLDFEQRC